MKDHLRYYEVGALLYTPADNADILHTITKEKISPPFSLALCLEDTLGEALVEQGERTLQETLRGLEEQAARSRFFLPKIFVRVRSPRQMKRIAASCSSSLLTGFILPKISPDNVQEYISLTLEINKEAKEPFYIMPILEDPSIISLSERPSILHSLKEAFAPAERYILNIRVGGNDLCHAFGFRRQSDETIYDILPIASILSDIVTVFGQDYILSAPVWEYYDGEGWDSGMLREIRKDILCGFIGKTVIHPKQVSLVNSGFQVRRKDYEDALLILQWESDKLVFASSARERMNEYKVHSHWASRILMLAKVYGIKEESHV